LKKIAVYIIFTATIVMTLTYLSNLYGMFFKGEFFERYGTEHKIIMFDFILLVPVIITLALKNSNKLKVWAVLCILLQNVVLFLDFGIGTIYGTVIGITLTNYFITNYKTFELNGVVGKSSENPTH